MIAIVVAWWSVANAQPPFAVDPGVNLEITSAAQFEDAAVLADGRVVVSGNHTRADGATVSGLVVLAGDGRHLPGSRPHCGTAAAPRACTGKLASQPDGGFLLARRPFAVDGVIVGPLVRFDASGQLDLSFNPWIGDASLHGVEVTRLVVGGDRAYMIVRASACPSPPCQRSLLGVDLATASALPASASVAIDDDLLTVDAQGRAYVRANGIVVRIDPATGQVDANWLAGLPAALQVTDLAYEPQTARLFVAAASADVPATLLRLDPAAHMGWEASWQVNAPGETGAFARVLGAARGTVLAGTTSAADATPGLALLDAASGRMLEETSTPGGTTVISARPWREEGWLVVPDRPDAWTPDAQGSTLVAVDRMLAPSSTFVTRLRRNGRVAGLARAADGTLYIAGAFSRIAELPRLEIASLAPDFAVSPAWPTDAGMPRYRDAIWQHATVNGDGVPAFLETIPVPSFTGVPRPSLRVSTAAGTPARRHSGVSGIVIGGSDAWFYVAPHGSGSGSLCILQGRLGRVSADALLALPSPGGCIADPTWSVPFSGLIDAVALDDSHIYFVNLPNWPTSEPATLRRASTAAGATVDPAWQVRVDRSGSFEPRVYHLSIAGPWLYIGGVFDRVNDVPTGPLVRVALATGELDPDWMPALPRAPAALAASMDWVYALVPTQPAAGQSYARADLYRWSAASASAPAILATDGAAIVDGGYEASRDARVGVLPDGRAVVVGYFTRIGDYGRDGFAVVGAIDPVFGDGFEAH